MPPFPRGIAMSSVKLLLVGLVVALLAVLPAATQQPKLPPPSAAQNSDGAADDDERLLDAAGRPSAGPGLLDFCRPRACIEVNPGQLEELVRRFTGPSLEDRFQAGTDLVALGPPAVPGLRRVANDLEDADVREHARRLLAWVEGPQSAALASAA